MTMRNTRMLLACLGLPFLLAGFLGAFHIHPMWLAWLLPPALIVMEAPGKYPSLALAWALWICLTGLIAGALPLWLGILVLASAVLVVTMLVVVVGRDWGQRRYASMAARGKPMREWEWVYVGRSFARAHDLHRLSPMIWLVGLGVSACMTLIWMRLYFAPASPHLLVWVGAIGFYALTLMALLRLWPVAYPMVSFALVPAIPFSLPLMVYWADGVRPNLIYRHRFERLIPKETQDV